MDRKQKRWVFKAVLVIGLIWSWMPVLIARDGNEGSKDESD